MIAAALERESSALARVVKDRRIRARWTDGGPVEALEGPAGPPFRRRRQQDGSPLREMRCPTWGPATDGALPTGTGSRRRRRGPIWRTRSEQAMYGRYQVDHLRSAVARKGIIGTAKEAAEPRQQTSAPGCSQEPLTRQRTQLNGFRSERSRGHGPGTRRADRSVGDADRPPAPRRRRAEGIRWAST